MNILILNQPLNNRGDESAHRALVRSIIKYIPEAHVRCLFGNDQEDTIRQFMVIDNRVEYVRVHHRKNLKSSQMLVKGLKYPLLWHLHPYVISYLNNYRWADAVVCAPGGICMGGFMNWEHQNKLMYGIKLHKPLFYYGRSIGPFWDEPAEKKLFKKRAVEILNYCSFVSLREAESIRIAHELGIKDVVSTVDSAFLDYPEVLVPSEIKEKIGNTPYVVFVPNLLIWHYFYKGKATKVDVVDFWSKIVDVISEHFPNHKIVMLPQTFNYANPDDNDVNLFYDIRNNRPESKIVVVEDKYSSDIQQTIIRGADAMFGSRYHSVVFAINNNVPFVAFSYEHKIAGLLEELKLQDEMIDIKDLFSSAEFNQKVIDTFNNVIPSIHRSLDAQKKAKTIAKECFLKFKNVICSL